MNFPIENLLAVTDEELCDKTLKWLRFSARRSGRSARQFIDDHEGRLGMMGGNHG